MEARIFDSPAEWPWAYYLEFNGRRVFSDDKTLLEEYAERINHVANTIRP